MLVLLCSLHTYPFKTSLVAYSSMVWKISSRQTCDTRTDGQTENMIPYNKEARAAATNLQIVVQSSLRELMLQVNSEVHILHRVNHDVHKLHACHLHTANITRWSSHITFSKSRSHTKRPTVVASLMLVACLVVGIIQH